MGTLVKFSSRKTKEAEAKDRNLATCVFGTSFILFTATSKGENLVTGYKMQNKGWQEIQHL